MCVALGHEEGVCVVLGRGARVGVSRGGASVCGTHAELVCMAPLAEIEYVALTS